MGKIYQRFVQKQMKQMDEQDSKGMTLAESLRRNKGIVLVPQTTPITEENDDQRIEH